MIFEFIKHAKSPLDSSKPFCNRDRLYDNCISAEKNVRTDPDKCFYSVRDALELLFRGVLKEAMVTFPDDTNLSGMMGLSKKIQGLWGNKRIIDNYYKIKNRTNEIIHPDTGEIEKHATVSMALDITLKLYNNLCSMFGVNSLKIDKHLFPFNEYEVIRYFKKEEDEPIWGDFSYFVQKKSSYITTYAIIRPFPQKNYNEYSERDHVTQDFFKKLDAGSNIISGHLLPVPDYCDQKYLVYDILNETTKTLNEFRPGELSSRNAIHIILQISKGLNTLITPEVSIHHRGIRPSCIFVAKNPNNSYTAKIGCFETAKISDDSIQVNTVYGDVSKRISNHYFYTHPALQSGSSSTNEEWEKGDVYSLVKVLITCLGIDESDLFSYFSDEFAEHLCNILEAYNLSDIPSMKEFEAILQEEYLNE